MVKSKFDYDLIVIGSGPAGSVAAELSARVGKKVAIIEQSTLGGTAPVTGDVPLQALLSAAHALDDARRASVFGIRTNTIGYNYPTVKNWKDLAIRRSGVGSTGDYFRSLGISVFKGRGHILSANEVSIARRHLSSEKILIATGARPGRPSITGLDSIDYLTSETAIDLIRPPKSLLIIGAGSTGLQFAELFSIFGTKVYLLDSKKRIISSEDDEVSEVMAAVLKQTRGVEIITSARVNSLSQEGLLVKVNYISGELDHSMKVERVMIATGWAPNVDIGLDNAGVEYDNLGIKIDNSMLTSAKNIFAAGAVTGRSGSTHEALQESKVVSKNLWSRNGALINRMSMPRIISTYPEVAAIGLNEADLAREDVKFTVSMVNNSVSLRANTSNFSTGFTKILADPKGSILGAVVVAPHASELISQIALAINNDINVHSIAETTPPFGSWSEVLRLACAKLK